MVRTNNYMHGWSSDVLEFGSTMGKGKSFLVVTRKEFSLLLTIGYILSFEIQDYPPALAKVYNGRLEI